MSDGKQADLGEVFDMQMQSQAVGVVTVDDGTVFLFSTEVLEALLTKSIESGQGKAMVFVKHQVVQ
jgi:hypothetical protein